MEEAMRLKEVVTRAGLDLTIKIGGCEAVKDMYDARTIGVSAIVAPMIESAYALSKYIKRATFVFPQEERAYIKFLFNIETITGLNALALWGWIRMILTTRAFCSTRRKLPNLRKNITKNWLSAAACRPIPCRFLPNCLPGR